MRRYAALPDGERPFTAPAHRKHVTDDASSEVEETENLQRELSDSLADDAATDSNVQPDSPQHKTQPSRSGMTESDDTARAQRVGRHMPAQHMYTQRPQLPSDWQR